jgi:hypothetical protein
MSSEDIENDLNNGVILNVPLLSDDIEINRNFDLRFSSKQNSVKKVPLNGLGGSCLNLDDKEQ